MTEPRKPRYKLQLRLAYDDGENFMTADVKDISESGVFLENVMTLKPGTRVTLTPLVEGELGVHELEGEVVRAVEDNEDDIENVPGMGIKFIDVDGDLIERLRTHLQDAGEPTGD